MAHLLKLYQDISHYQNELIRNDNEQDVFVLLESMTRLQQHWQTAEHQLVGAQRLLTSYETDVVKARLETKELKAQLVEARSQISSLATTQQELEREKLLLEDQVDLVRELLRDEVHSLPEYSRKRLQFLNDRPSKAVAFRDQSASVLSAIGNAGDKTEDSLDGEAMVMQRTKGVKRSGSATRAIPSAPSGDDFLRPTPRKRSKDDLDALVTAVQSKASEEGITHHLQVNGHTPLNRSFSEPQLLTPQPVNRFLSIKSVENLAAVSPTTATLNANFHAFTTRTNLTAAQCNVCEKRIGFAHSFRRCENCGLQSHFECCQNAALPCIAHGTPANKQREKLADYVPRQAPMVPNIVVHCINEIEQRGLTSIGIYRVPGSEAQVLDLLQRFLSVRQGVPNLRKIGDINVVAGCLKKFLQQLKDSLIPQTSWTEFVRAASIFQSDSSRDAISLLEKSIAELPQPNRDTLAFIILHLQRVLQYSGENKMDAPNLARVFAPTVVGYSTPTIDLKQGVDESAKQQAVMDMLMKMPPDYWERILATTDVCPMLRGICGSSDSKPPLFSNVLGPNPSTSTQGTPTSAYRARMQKKQYFQPPWK